MKLLRPAPVSKTTNRPSLRTGLIPTGIDLANAPSFQTAALDSLMRPDSALSIGTCTSPVDPPGTVTLTVAQTWPASVGCFAAGGAVASGSAALPPARWVLVHATRTISCMFGSCGASGASPGTQKSRAVGLPTPSHTLEQPTPLAGHQCVACTHWHPLVALVSDVAPVHFGRCVFTLCAQSEAQ